VEDRLRRATGLEQATLERLHGYRSLSGKHYFSTSTFSLDSAQFITTFENE
jgi:hypothetical protein